MLVNSLAQITHNPKDDRDLQDIFRACFYAQFNTQLLGGAPEPLYTPANNEQALHIIYYRDDYFSSALHEIAHWCIAGEKRRGQVDYGYWYTPDGRTAQQQASFELLEEKPQALEWAFSIACDIPFSVSIDNLNAQNEANEAYLSQQQQQFTQAVNKQLRRYINEGFPARAKTFLIQLSSFYGTNAFKLRLTEHD